MTYEEALKYAESYITVKGIPIDSKEATKCIVEALEKQIPKRPKVTYDWYLLNNWKCPECNKKIDSPMGYSVEKYPFCPYCGQAINWEVE